MRSHQPPHHQFRQPWTILPLLAVALSCFDSRAGEPSSTHPLMPGLRSTELANPNWPRILHDELATGFSPLTCGMDEAPQIWCTRDFGGAAQWVHVLHEPDGADRLLVYDGRLRLINREGAVAWTATAGVSSPPVYYGPLGGADRQYAGRAMLFASGPKLLMLDADDGAACWTYEFGPPHVQLQVVVEDILPDLPGVEAAVGQRWGEDGCVINFPPDGEPRVIWQNKIVVPGEYDERYDHYGGELQVDLSDPAQPLLWSIRRYRCRGFDARTGKMVSSLEYAIGGEQRRNYGPWKLGRDKRGQLLAIVVSEQVQEHVHAIRLRRDRDNELAWQHWYGEVFKNEFGVAVENLAIDDLDGDGDAELAYSVRDPAQDFRSFVRVRDAGTGEIQWELSDRWGVTAFAKLGADRSSGLVACQAPAGGMSRHGELEVYRFSPSHEMVRVAALHNAQLWGPQKLEIDGRQLLVVRETNSSPAAVTLYDLIDGALKPTDTTVSDAILTQAPLAVLATPQRKLAGMLFISVDQNGSLTASTWEGERRWSLDLEGGSQPTMSAADLDNDGRAELVALTPNNRVQVLSIDDAGTAREVASYEYAARWHAHSPLLFDCLGDGAYCLVTPVAAADGRLAVSVRRGDGSILWSTPLDVPAERVESFAAVGGRFLPGRLGAIGVSVSDHRHTLEGFHLLRASDGRVLWSKHLHRDGYVSMPYRMYGAPTAYDFDRDGVDDIGIDMLSYMAFLRGKDGSFAYVCHTPNIRTENATYAGHLYNTFRPVFKTPDDDQPHWFASGGHGAFGLMNPDVVSGAWRVDLAYDTPPAVGMIDVDADGVLEVGYTALNSRKFICRNLWTGEVEWELELPYPPNAPCLSADVDADGRGEFLIGSFCIGAGEPGQGRLEWQSPTPMGWAVIADFDGDGDGEIACPRAGGIAVLNAK
ncbi:MAG: hypothetical protein IT424_06790 [Pirellulales bacterium]|nr:hypothetical protein [Pirellulales bacterium]